ATPTDFFHRGQDFRNREQRSNLLLVTFAFDYLKQGFVLGGVMFDVETFLSQLCQQVFDGVAFIKLFMTGATGGSVLCSFDDGSIALLVAGKPKVQVGVLLSKPR